MKAKMRERKLNSGVNRQWALKLKGIIQTDLKQGLGVILCFKNTSRSSPNHLCQRDQRLKRVAHRALCESGSQPGSWRRFQLGTSHGWALNCQCVRPDTYVAIIKRCVLNVWKTVLIMSTASWLGWRQCDLECCSSRLEAVRPSVQSTVFDCFRQFSFVCYFDNCQMFTILL